MKPIFTPTFATLALVAYSSLHAAAPQINADLLNEFQLRNLGPALSPGRVADIAVDPRNGSVWYIATASSGLWKTRNRGETWEAVFDNGGADLLGCGSVDPQPFANK